MSEKINTVFSFPGTGIDTDSDLVTIGIGDSRYRKNISVSDDGNYNILTNSLGNTLKTHTLTGTTTPKVVGYVEDKENDAGIFFIYDSTPTFKHYIVRYNASDDTFTDIIAQETALNFSSDKFIDAGIIGNEDDQYLVWADGDAPKGINIAKAIAGGYTTYNDEVLSFYKYPLISLSASINADYTTSIPRAPNKDLSNKIFQFAIRLKYDDKSYSTLSHRSVIPFPEENIPSGRASSDIGYDLIRVTVDIQNEPSVVDVYQLLYRVVDVGAGASGVWNIYEEYPYSSKGVKTLSFLNDKSIGIVSDAEAARPYDYVPDASNHIGAIDSNRAVFDVAQEGYDNVDVDVTMSLTETAIPSSEEGIISSVNPTVSSGSPYTITRNIVYPSDYYFVISFSTGTYSLYTYGVDGIDVYTEFKVFVDGLGLADLSTTVTSNSITFTVLLGSTETHEFTSLILDKTKTFRTEKTGSKHKFGIEYGYNGKRGPVQTSSDCVIPVDDFSDVSATNSNYHLNAIMTINHAAPVGATDFRVVSFGTDVDYFEEYMVHFNGGTPTDNSSDYTMYLENQFTVIKRDEMVNRFRSAYGGGSEIIGSDSVNFGIDYGFDFQVGDIVKFIGYSDLSVYPFYDIVLVGGLDYYIESVSSSEIRINSAAIRAVLGSMPSLLYNYWVIQIIRKKNTFDSIAQEFSPSIPISFHSNPINVTEYFSSTWKSKQVFINESNYSDYGLPNNLDFFSWMEKPKISLYYDSYPTSQGRVNAVNEFSQARGYNKIRWGGKFIDDAGVNFMSKFEFDDEKLLDDRNGTITKIQQIGDTLKVYQERKVSSLYLKTTSADDPNGTSTFVFSDNVMSDPRQSAVDYGCTHFTSYARDVRDSYFFDLGNKTALVDTPGGIMSIADGTYKMSTYFSEKAAAINAYGKDLVQVHGEYDDDLDLYVLSFIVPLFPAHSINDTVAFHVPSKRWITHFSLPTARKLEYYGRLTGNTLVSFVGGQLYLHNSNTTRNNFWGEQFDSEVWIHANESPILNKIYDSIELNSVGEWSCPDNDSIEINKPSLMRSRIPIGRFKRQEGIYRSDFLRNALNASLTFIRNLLINGKLLRGREMTIKLKNSETTEAQLETVIIKSTISK